MGLASIGELRQELIRSDEMARPGRFVPDDLDQKIALIFEVSRQQCDLQSDMSHAIQQLPAEKLRLGSLKYKGELKRGIPHGMGMEVQVTTEQVIVRRCPETVEKIRRHLGQFARGSKNGLGQLTIGKLTLTDRPTESYVGDFKDGKYHGLGILKRANEKKYVGEFLNGKSEGVGELRISNGCVYRGEFVKNLFHGQGVLEYPSGDRYEGSFENGSFHGHGCIYFADGRRFIALFNQSPLDLASGHVSLHGREKGVLFKPNGDQLVSEFSFGSFSSRRGRIQTAEGNTYIGGWNHKIDRLDCETEYVKHGEGVLIFPHGTELYQLWDAGELIEERQIKDPTPLIDILLKELDEPSDHQEPRGQPSSSSVVSSFNERIEHSQKNLERASLKIKKINERYNISDILQKQFACIQTLQKTVLDLQAQVQRLERASLKQKIRLPDESMYKGSVVDGCPHGNGTLTYKDGSSFSGSFNLGKKSGFGIFTSNLGHKSYGEYRDNVKEGFWSETCKEGSYEGHYLKGLRHGRGTLTLGRNIFEGQFEKGRLMGGVARLSNGTVFKTKAFKQFQSIGSKNISDNLLSGFGVWRIPEGAIHANISIRGVVPRIGVIHRDEDDKVCKGVAKIKIINGSFSEGYGKFYLERGYVYEGVIGWVNNLKKIWESTITCQAEGGVISAPDGRKFRGTKALYGSLIKEEFHETQVKILLDLLS